VVSVALMLICGERHTYWFLLKFYMLMQIGKINEMRERTGLN